MGKKATSTDLGMSSLNPGASSAGHSHTAAVIKVRGHTNPAARSRNALSLQPVGEPTPGGSGAGGLAGQRMAEKSMMTERSK